MEANNDMARHRSCPNASARCFFLAILLIWFCAPLLGQCDIRWTEHHGIPGADGEVFAVAEWDPDGAGPLQPRLVAGGRFGAIGGTAARHLAVRDPQTSRWSEIGGGVDGWVHDILPLPNGHLVVVGDFVNAGAIQVNRVARWDGVAWQSFGTGCLYQPNALTLLPNGDIVVSGYFPQIDNVMAANIARWDGVAWHAMGTGLPQGGAVPPALLGGELLAVEDRSVRRWDGTQWHHFVQTNGTIHSLATDGVARVLIAGFFQLVGPASISRLALWDGLTWQGVGNLGSSVTRAWLLRNGDPVIGMGSLNVGSGTAFGLARWDGSAWHAFGTGVSAAPFQLEELSSGNIVVAGSFSRPGLRIAEWDGSTWHSASPGCDGEIRAAVTLSSGATVVAGSYTLVGDIQARSIATWSSAGWTAMGTGLDGEVDALAELPNGDVVAGGNFWIPGAHPAAYLARWDGSSWSPFAAGQPNGRVRAVASHGGDLYVAGAFTNIGTIAASRIARWDGTAWHAFPQLIDASVSSLLVRSSGELFIGGDFTWVGGTLARRVARWNGTVWSRLGDGFSGSSVEHLTQLPNGDVVVSGWLGHAYPTVVNNIARWDGVAWRAMGAGLDAPATASFSTANGDFVVGGRFQVSGATAVPRLARWDGSTWRTFGTVADGAVQVLCRVPQGILVGGRFLKAGDNLTGPLVRIEVPCSARSTTVGSGCVGGGGLLTLSAVNSPWSGETFMSRADNVPANAAAIAVYGFQRVAVTLTALSPLAHPGCTGLTTPDVAYLRPVTAGVAASELPVPADPAIVGVQVRHQFLTLEMDGAGLLIGIASSNGLDLTFGAY